MLPRFFAPDLEADARTVTLGVEETHHLVHVLRLKRGAVVRVFDGEGHEWEGAVASLDKRGAVVDDLRPVPALSEPRVSMTVIAGILRGQAMDTLVRDAPCWAAVAIVPVHTEYTSESRTRDRRSTRTSRGGGGSSSAPASSAGARWCRRSARLSRSPTR